MIYVGIDVSKDKHDCCILEPEHKSKYKQFTITNDWEGFDFLLKQICSYKQPAENIKVGLEATGPYSENITRFLLNNGLPTYVFNPMLTDQYKKSHSLRKTKTDRIDAHFIACIFMSDLDLKPYVPKEYHNERLMSLARSRFRMVKARTKIKQDVDRLVVLNFPELGKYMNLNSATAHAIFMEYPTPEELANANLKHLKNIIHKASRGSLNGDLAEQIRDEAKKSIGKHNNLGNEHELRADIRILEDYDEEIRKIEAEEKELLSEHPEPILTIPGIGAVTGAAILAEVGDFSRFSSPDKVLAYAGLAPSRNQSGRRSGIGQCAHMEKRGSRYLRFALFNAAIFVCRYEPAYKEYLAKKLNEGKHYYIAISHAAKKLVRLIYALQTTGNTYKTSAQLMLQKQINTSSDSQNIALDI
jgi:transposase